MPKPNGIITLTTDFGLVDQYVASIKGVILGINPEAKIVDITHSVEKYNIKQAAFILFQSVPFFPEGTIHVAVVDPGVGSERNPIIVQTAKEFLVGPDNGIFSLVAEKHGVEAIIRIDEEAFMLKPVSSSFHGRDIFAPVAAYLSLEVSPEEMGKRVEKMVRNERRVPRIVDNSIEAEVIHVDSFGNIVTDVSADVAWNVGLRIGMKVLLRARSGEVSLPFHSHYSAQRGGEPLILVGSHGYLEIAVNMGNAAGVLGIKPGDTIWISL